MYSKSLYTRDLVLPSNSRSQEFNESESKESAISNPIGAPKAKQAISIRPSLSEEKKKGNLGSVSV
jgi:hypothetical protein